MDDALLLAYCAGVMDSDGWLTINKHSPNRAFPISTTFSELIGMCQTDPTVPTLFREVWGGYIQERKRKPDAWKTCYYWNAGNKKAITCITDLRPYLRVKGAQADLLLALRASKDRPRSETKNVRVGVRGTKVNAEVYAEREALWRQIRALNDNRVRPLD